MPGCMFVNDIPLSVMLYGIFSVTFSLKISLISVMFSDTSTAPLAGWIETSCGGVRSIGFPLFGLHEDSRTSNRTENFECNFIVNGFQETEESRFTLFCLFLERKILLNQIKAHVVKAQTGKISPCIGIIQNNSEFTRSACWIWQFSANRNGYCSPFISRSCYLIISNQ